MNCQKSSIGVFGGYILGVLWLGIQTGLCWGQSATPPAVDPRLPQGSQSGDLQPGNAQPGNTAGLPQPPNLKSATPPKKSLSFRVPRNEHLKRPGAPRKKDVIVDFRTSIQMKYTEPTPTEISKFNQMKNGLVKQVDRGIIDKTAKAHVFSLTKRDNESTIALQLEEVYDALKPMNASITPPEVLEMHKAYTSYYKERIIVYCKELINNSLLVRVNMMHMVNSLYNPNHDAYTPAGLEIYEKMLADSTQPDAIHYLALKGAILAKQQGLTTIGQEVDFARMALALTKNRDVQPVLETKMAEAMGVFGSPHAGELADRTEVAVFLGKIILNPEAAIESKIEAGVALGNLMRLGQIPTWNHQLQMVLIAIAIRDLHRYYQAYPQKMKDELFFYHMTRLLLASLRVKDQLEDDVIRALFEPQVPIFKNVAEGVTPDLYTLSETIKAIYPPKVAKFAKLAEPLNFPTDPEGTLRVETK